VSVLAELERLKGAVGAQKARVAELDRARSAGGRRVEEARERLLSFYRDRERVGGQTEAERQAEVQVTGEAILVEQDGLVVEVGGESEMALIEDLRGAQSDLQMRASVIPYGGGVQDVELQAVDPRAEAMYEGAVAALAERQQELRQFVRDRIADIAAERAPLAQAVQARVAAALEEGRGAAGAYESQRTWWAQTLSAGGLEGELMSIPDNPLRWASQPAEAGLPMPASFT
jgi:hypothetical protein